MKERKKRSAIKHRHQEGAVMLVVMLILLTATTMAGIALQSTQFELRASGSNRIAVQTQYVAEAAMATTLSWIDGTSALGAFYNSHLVSQRDRNLNNGYPTMTPFGEPPLIPHINNIWANRTRWEQQRELLTTYETAPLTVAGGLVAKEANPATPPQVVDPIGSFGPRSNFVPGMARNDKTAQVIVDYSVDLYDCQQLPVTASPGSQVNQTGSGVPQPFQFYCVVTARGRSYLPGAQTKEWTLPNGAVYSASRFSASHDARGTVVTPPIFAL